MRTFICYALTTVLIAAFGSARAEVRPAKVIAVLGVELVDTSLEWNGRAPSSAEQRRLERIAALIREALEESHSYAVVNPDRTRTLILAMRPSQYLHDCNGCELDLGRALGADWVLVAWVQKVSNLILNLNVVVWDVETSVRIATAFVDLRGNTDESWTRATRYLLDRILLKRLTEKH